MMKKYTFFRWSCALATLLLGMTLPTACGDDDPPSPPTEVARIAYYVKGVVTDLEGQPLQGIDMKVMEDFQNQFGYQLLSSPVQTNEAGEYQTEVVNDATIHDGLVLVAEDPKGIYLPDTLDLTGLQRVQVNIGDDFRDQGRWELTGNVRLRTK
ncbi:MAG: radical SAM-associated putative lipoprotein [Bacteroidaceae bacterium]|nr:radical SAM-associated putative lipoprotein [Bacteroidaceae bacterium]